LIMQRCCDTGGLSKEKKWGKNRNKAKRKRERGKESVKTVYGKAKGGKRGELESGQAIKAHPR